MPVKERTVSVRVCVWCRIARRGSLSDAGRNAIIKSTQKELVRAFQ